MTTKLFLKSVEHLTSFLDRKSRLSLLLLNKEIRKLMMIN